MTVIIQISDTHFGTEVAEVKLAAQKAIEDLNPEIVILSGDITQRARPTQFKAAKEFMDALPAPHKITIPGNHDIPLYNIFSRFFMPYRNYEKAFKARQQLWTNGQVIIAALDSTTPYRHTRGRLKNNKLYQDLQNLKPSHPEDTIVIAVTHQPLAVALTQDSDEILENASQIAQNFANAGVDIALSGHVHYPLITTTASYYEGLPRNFILSGAGTAISYRTRPGAPNSFNNIVVSPNNITITKYEYDAALKQFTSASRHSFARSGSGWALQ